MGTLTGGSTSLGSFDTQHRQTFEKTDVATFLDIIALKVHVTQLDVNQAEMTQFVANQDVVIFVLGFTVKIFSGLILYLEIGYYN